MIKKLVSVVFLLTLWCDISEGSAVLLHHYRFDSDASDSVGTANGTLLNGASVSGGVLNLDGVNNYVQFGSHIVPVSGSYSVALFARADFLKNDHVEFISQGFSSGPGFYVGHDPSHIIRMTDSFISTGIPMPTDGHFHHYAMVVDTSLNDSFLYVDGVLRASSGFAITTTPAGTATRLGRQFEAFAEFFPGSLDDVRIYSGALTAEEVRALAFGGVPFAFGTFAAKVKITLGPLSNDDTFDIKGSFTLGAGSDGIAPLTEDVHLQVGTFSATIAAGSFEEDASKNEEASEEEEPQEIAEGGQFKFEGVSGGVALEFVIEPLGGGSFGFNALGSGANLTGTGSQVIVKLTIGGDSGP